MTLINFSKNDINYQLCYDAHRGTSFTPDKRADQEIASYLAHMAEVAQKFSAFVTAENEADLKADLEKYRLTYISKYNALLYAKSRVMSAFITGPSNFPTARNQKRANTEDKRRKEFLDWQEKALKRLSRKYNPAVLANAPISSDDDDALAKLQAKIDQAEKDQEQMKAVNKIIRSSLSDKQKAAKIDELGLSQELLQYFMRAGVGKFPSYRLTNNNANIRRMKARIIELEKEGNRDEAEDYQITVKGAEATVSENQGENRLQLFFEGKPPTEVRTILKQNGFRWAPSQGAWQRLLNDNARHTLDYIRD